MKVIYKSKSTSLWNQVKIDRITISNKEKLTLNEKYKFAKKMRELSIESEKIEDRNWRLLKEVEELMDSIIFIL